MQVPDSGQKALVVFCYVSCKPGLLWNQIKDFVKGEKSIETKGMEIVERVLWTEFWKYNKKLKKAKTDAEREQINKDYAKVYEDAQIELKVLEEKK